MKLFWNKNGFSFKSLKSIPILNTFEQLKSVYMSSYDLMMMKIYKQDSIKLPVRINTLDFNRIFDNNRHLNDTGRYLIQDSYFVMK